MAPKREALPRLRWLASVDAPDAKPKSAPGSGWQKVESRPWPIGDQPKAKVPRLGHPAGPGSSALSSTASSSTTCSGVSSSSSQALVGRRDAPMFKPTAGGDRQLALQATASQATKLKAMNDLEDAMTARSNQGPLSSLWRTWLLFHEKWRPYIHERPQQMAV